jgi:hypothetical protein
MGCGMPSAFNFFLLKKVWGEFESVDFKVFLNNGSHLNAFYLCVRSHTRLFILETEWSTAPMDGSRRARLNTTQHRGLAWR